MLNENQSCEFRIFVKDTDLASAMFIDESDSLPDVFATYKMIAYMELAAARLLMPLLQPGQLSVGVDVQVSHLAATLRDQEVKSVATFIKMEGKLYHFRVQAFDNGGKIGEGTHTRAIINQERLIAGARRKLGI